MIEINLKLNIYDAALIRDQLFQNTKQDSYEFPGKRTVVIREFIGQLDREIESNLPDDSNDI
tara:strand:- start:295 stop:480 length:186 start_codon:yes stop_codon:yes gene_type:complete